MKIFGRDIVASRPVHYLEVLEEIHVVISVLVRNIVWNHDFIV